jgi:DinB superfamily
MDRNHPLRQQLVELLRGGNAHMSFADAVADFPEDKINLQPPNVDYTFWHLVEHLRLAQADILAYLTRADYVALEWPADYWPPRDARATKQDWDDSVAAFERDLDAIVVIVVDEATDLFAAVPSCPDHTILREALIVADHNAYHVGEMGSLRQIVGARGPGHDG